VAVLGADGQLGSDLVAHFAAAGDEVAALTHADVEVADEASVRAALAAARPDVVLDTAAFHHLPSCEDDPARAFAVNAQGAHHVARAARDLGATPVYFSTDYVFDGTAARPYTEEDLPRPLSVYGASKLAGEHLTLAGGPAWVLRVSALYGRVPSRAKGDNFLTMITRRAREQRVVRVVADEVTAPTPTPVIARATRDILRTGEPGLYHLACRGSCSWHDFTRAIFDLLGIDTPLEPARSADFPTPVRRPPWSVLDSGRYEALGVGEMPPWREALTEFLREHGAMLTGGGGELGPRRIKAPDPGV
jgi:dTDP-4-dehydrorhamnose reductase